MIGGKLDIGLTAEERFKRRDVCEDFAHQPVAVAHKDEAKFPEHSRELTMRRVRQGIEGKEWTSSSLHLTSPMLTMARTL
jgi:hypothetical protein